MGYKFQFITLAGFHQLNNGMFELARGYKARQMAAYSSCRKRSSPPKPTATRDQASARGRHRLLRRVSMAITGGQSSTTAMHESTEHAQFKPAAE